MARRTRGPRRPTDRIEDFVSWLLFAAGLIVLMLSVAAGLRVDDAMLARGHQEALDRTPVTARLLEASPWLPVQGPSDGQSMIRASWLDRDGLEHTGLVSTPQGRPEGAPVGIWIDATGASVPAPTSAGDALMAAVGVAVLVLCGGLAVLACAWLLLRRATWRANSERWDREWREVAPGWTRSHGGRA